jgi:hypothetical protein
MLKQRDLLAATTIAAAVTGALGEAEIGLGPMKHLAVQANFTYAAGGTTAKVWVQTSLDGGTTWIDIACFAFTTASKRAIASVNAETSVTTIYPATDATLGDDSVKDGILGDRVRVKYTTTGTYTGATTLQVSVVPKS